MYHIYLWTCMVPINPNFPKWNKDRMSNKTVTQISSTVLQLWDDTKIVSFCLITISKTIARLQGKTYWRKDAQFIFLHNICLTQFCSHKYVKLCVSYIQDACRNMCRSPCWLPIIFVQFQPRAALCKNPVLLEHDTTSWSKWFFMFQRYIVPYLQGSKISQNWLLSDAASYTRRKEFSTMELSENV